MNNSFVGLWIINNIRNNWGIGRSTRKKSSQPERSKREDLAANCSHLLCISGPCSQRCRHVMCMHGTKCNQE